MTEEQRCYYFMISRTQRTMERRRGLPDLGTKGYEMQGCYNCNGYDKQCKIYQEQLEEK